MPTLTHAIDGRHVAGGESTRAVVDPATGRAVATMPVGSTDTVDAAVRGAATAAPSWGGSSPERRAAAIGAGVARALAAVDELAELQCREMGQPWAVARPLAEQSLLGLHEALESACAYPFVSKLDSGDATTEVLRLPRGVGALISPWNFPLPVALGGLGSLLAGGNTVVWKPSELSPLSAVRLVELLDLPAGVLNVVLGDAGTGRALCSHRDVAIGVFTGSVSSGRDVAARFAERFCPVLLELGGKDPVVIDDDVDPEWAAEVVAFGAFWNTGQVCTSMERIYVHQGIAASFVDALVAIAENYVVGPPLDPGTQLGPLVSERQRDLVVAHVEEAVATGARVLTGGRTPAGPGFFYPPTVVADVARGMRLHDEETFGPIAAVQVVPSFDAGIQEARTSEYGLCATLLTGRDEHARRGAEIPSAMCWVNEWQGGAPGSVYEPARISGIGAVGTLDSVTRPMTLHRAPLSRDRRHTLNA
jgi:succinate-semialdehyde dehydrogenase/glutarate-semialdehyde dehydrogenase